MFLYMAIVALTVEGTLGCQPQGPVTSRSSHAAKSDILILAPGIGLEARLF